MLEVPTDTVGQLSTQTANNPMVAPRKEMQAHGPTQTDVYESKGEFYQDSMQWRLTLDKEIGLGLGSRAGSQDTRARVLRFEQDAMPETLFKANGQDSLSD